MYYRNFLLFFCLCSFSVVVFGQKSPTQIYLDKRNEAISAAEKGMTSKEIEAELNGPLKNMIQDAIGAFNIEGFPKEWKYNIDSLTRGDPGFYALDGLRATSLDGKTQAVVSTIYLLRAWLQSQEDIFQDDMKSALKSGRFYTNVFVSDAYAYKYTEIPVVTSNRSTIAEAILFTYGSDYVAPASPNKIGLAIIKNNLVYVLIDDITIPIKAMPTCKAAFEQEIRSGGGWVRPQEQHREGKYTWSAIDAIAKKANDNFLRCFNQRVASQKYYKILIKQAQALISNVENKQKSTLPTVHLYNPAR